MNLAYYGAAASAAGRRSSELMELCRQNATCMAERADKLAELQCNGDMWMGVALAAVIFAVVVFAVLWRRHYEPVG